MKRHRIERLLEARNLEEEAAGDEEVIAIWNAALRDWRDSEAGGLSTSGAFSHVYQAGFRTATVLIRAAGYRVRGAIGGHHHNTFYAAGALGGETIEEIADLMQDIRGDRHTALYGVEEELDPEDLEAARQHVRRLMGEVHSWIARARPQLAHRLAAPPLAKDLLT